MRVADDGAKIAGSAQVAEFEIANLGGVVDTNPYASLNSLSGVTYAAIFGCGGEYVSSGIAGNPASAALHVSATNGVGFRKGINIAANAIDGVNATSGTSTAISLARGHEVVWYTKQAQHGGNRDQRPRSPMPRSRHRQLGSARRRDLVQNIRQVSAASRACNFSVRHSFRRDDRPAAIPSLQPKKQG